jgi:hypothetical protein
MAYPGIAIHDPTINGISDLPSAYDLSVPSPLGGILSNLSVERVYAIVAKPWDPAAAGIATWPPGGAQGVYLSSNEYHTTPADTPANQHFSARLQSPYNFQVNLFSSGKLAAHSLPGYGTISVLIPDGVPDYLTGLSWGGCSIAIYLGAKGAPWSQFTQIFQGTVASGGVTWTTETLSIPLRDQQALFAVPIQKQLYTSPCPQVGTSVTDYVGFSTFPAQTGSLTIEGFVYVADLVTVQRFVFMDDLTHGWAVNLNVSANGTMRFVTRDLSNVGLETAANALVTGWNHFACVYDHSGQTKTIYVTAVSVASAASLTGVLVAPSVALSALGAATGIGCTAGTRFSNLRVWNTARTQAQIQTWMRQQVLLNLEPGLIGYWSGWAAGDGVGTTIHDLTAAANNGTFHGAVTWGTGDWVDPSIAGKPVPLAYGVVRQAEAVCTDPNTPGGPMYQGHDRAMQSYDAVYDKGGPLTAVTQYTTYLGYGLFQLAQAPAGQITYDAHGDNVGGFVSSAADVSRRIASRHAGIADPAGMNLPSIAATNAANSAVVGYATGVAPVNIDAVLDAVMSSAGGWWATNRLGLFTVGVLVAPGPASLYLTEKDVIIDAKPLQRLATPDPPWRLRLGYHRIWKPGQVGTFVTSLSAALQYQYSQLEATLTANGSLPAPAAGAPLAEDRQESTLLDLAADAQKEADRRYALVQPVANVPRGLYQVALAPTKLFGYYLGDVVSPTVTLQNQSGPVVRLLKGANYVVVGVVENVLPSVDQPDDIQLTLWG